MGRKRNINFDILRIVAAGIVFTVHLGQFTGMPKDVENGFYSVWLFFIMSGYLVFASLDKTKTLKEYWIKRVVRIIPLYWTMLVFIWVYDLLRGIVVDKVSLIEMISYKGACGVRFLRYFIFANMFVPSENYDLWNNRYGLWTMSAFALFYLIAPLFKKIADSFWKSLIVYVLLFEVKEYLPDVIVSIFEPKYGAALDTLPVMNPFCVMYVFWIGVCAYYAVKEGKQLIYGGLLILSFMFFWFRGTEYDVMLGLIIMLAGSTSMVVSNEKLGKFISIASKCSWALYLTHLLWFDVVTRACSFIGAGLIVRWPLMVAGGLSMAYFACKGIEPVEKWVDVKMKALL